ncbi:MAG: hypothetical protein PQ964_09250 [Methanobacteriaceae archaeon]|jgi:hypothetical protein
MDFHKILLLIRNPTTAKPAIKPPIMIEGFNRELSEFTGSVPEDALTSVVLVTSSTGWLSVF